MDKQPEQEYISYNGLGRSPMLWGIPYMFFLMFGSGSILISMLFGIMFGIIGWCTAFLIVPILIYVRMICETDDRALSILWLELKWSVIKFFSGNAKYHGGTLTIAPITYGRKNKYVKRYFEKTIGK